MTSGATSSCGPWLFRIVHNEAVSALRGRRPSEPLDELPQTGATVEERAEAEAELATLRADLGALPERQRAALVLRELNGLGHREIAQALGLTPELVKQQIFQARTALMQAREGREMACADIRRALSDGDGRTLRGIRMRAHLRSCASCRRFQEDLTRRPRELAMLAPPLPAAAAGALLERLLPAGAAAGTAAAAAPKIVASLAVLAAAAGGGELARHHARPAPAPRPAAVRPAPTVVPARTASAVPTAAPSRPPARGKSATAPGHSGATRGKSASAPGHSGATRGKSATAPGHGGAARGKSATAPGHSGSTRGKAAAAPGHGGAPRGTAVHGTVSAPGQTVRTAVPGATHRATATAPASRPAAAARPAHTAGEAAAGDPPAHGRRP